MIRAHTGGLAASRDDLIKYLDMVPGVSSSTAQNVVTSLENTARDAVLPYVLGALGAAVIAVGIAIIR